MRPMHRSLAVILWAGIAGCHAASGVATPAVQPLDSTLTVAAQRSRAPGAVAAIYHNGRITELFAWGGADCAGGGAANAFAAYEIGSISKQMTAVALLQIWEQAKVNLDAGVGTYLDSIPDAWRQVTLRQLLTHTSGVPDYEEAATYAIYETSPSPAEVYATVSGRPLDFAPGSQWSYSNTGYFLLSLVVQHVSGERFGDYLRRHVFDPNGMRQTFMGGYSAPDPVPLAQGCRPGKGEGAARIPVRPITEASTFGAGGIRSTLEDWARWDDALADGRLLSDSAMKQLLTPVVLPDGKETGYAFGIEVDRFRGERRYSHTGQTQGFVAFYATFPDRNTGVMLFTNQYQANPGALMNGLVIRAVPELSYDRLVAPVDPDPARSELIRRAIRQVILQEQPLDLLDDDMLGFARDTNAAPQRERLHDFVANAERIEYLRSEDAPNSGYVRHLYRYVSGGTTSYFTAGWRDGKLHRLRYEEE